MDRKGLIGVQMSTISPMKMPNFDAYEAMAKLTDIGYRCIEISQVPMNKENIDGFKRAVRELNMNVAACTASVAPLSPGHPGEYLSNPDTFRKIVEDCHNLDCDMLRVGMIPMNCIGSMEKTVEFSKQAEDAALRLKEEGIDLYYHNHHIEFKKVKGKYLLDIIREHAPHMGFELDIHWIQRGGENPVDIIKKYAGSVRLLHLKDYRIGEMEMTQPKQGLSPAASAADFRNRFRNTIEFAEIGEGSLPIKACIEAGLSGGSEYFLVEQDECYGKDPFDCLRISRDNLVDMGYGDWF